MIRLVWSLAVLLLIFAVGPARAQTAWEERWTYSLTPYLWLPSVDGTLKYQLPAGTGSPSVDVNGQTLLHAIDFAFMMSGEARRGRWSFFGDYIYLKLSGSQGAVKSVNFNTGDPPVAAVATLNAGTESRLKGDMVTLAAGYSLAGSADSPFDVIGGLRYFGVTASTDWRLSAAVTGSSPGQTFAAAGSVSQTDDLWDGIVGVRGRAKLADHWYLPYYADVGTGSSRVTWQAFAGVSYAFHWGEVTLAYRHLVYDQRDDKLLQDFRFSGPLLGATFRF